ncbi:hypothetical protein HU746_03265 [Pseudomonas lurida]|uniref:hypothetical protein n=1 Tax=Pseudomonas lurida TaxID=244566 RepID=UPI0016474599|nr:hypothetical protein [Pseudomonas lurida]MBC3243658.1 hypothetical protein [Pseudomonas lurida]
MTFRPYPVFDQYYSCPTGHDSPDHPTDLDNRTWTCRTCQQRVHITVADKAGNHFIVERCPASEIRPGDFLIYREKAGVTAGQVTASNPYQGKGQRWHMAVEGFGSDRIAPEQFVNRIPG